MRLTYTKLDEFQAMAVANKKALYDRFVQANKVLANQRVFIGLEDEIKVIAEYNFWGGYHYAMMKVEEFRRLKSSNENNPL